MKLSAFEDGWDLWVGQEGGVKNEAPLPVLGCQVIWNWYVLGERTLKGERPDPDEEDDGLSSLHEQGLKCPKAKNMDMSSRHLRYQKVFDLERQTAFGKMNSSPRLLDSFRIRISQFLFCFIDKNKKTRILLYWHVAVLRWTNSAFSFVTVFSPMEVI